MPADIKRGMTKMPQYDARATCLQIMGTDLERPVYDQKLYETRRFFCLIQFQFFYTEAVKGSLQVVWIYMI